MFLWKNLDPGAAARALEFLLRRPPSAKRPPAGSETLAASSTVKGREAAGGS